MPWYEPAERALRPLGPYSTLILLGIAAVTVYIALRGDSVAKIAWLVYVVSP